MQRRHSRPAHPRRLLIALTLLTAALTGLTACSSGTPGAGGGSSATDAAGKLVVWVDASREAQAKTYAKEHGASNFTIVVQDAAQLVTKLNQVKNDASTRPDVVFTPSGNAPSLAQKYGIVQDLSSSVSSSVQKGFGSALTSCKLGNQLVCLPNDEATVVLWYNPQLLDEFHMTVPKTFTEYEAFGKEIAKDHPGYIIGSCADWACPNVFFRSNGCDGVDSNNGKSAVVDLTSDKCREVVDTLDPLIQNKSIATVGPFDTDMATLLKTGKVALLPGFVWYPAALYAPNAEKGTLAAAPFPTWSDGKKQQAASIGGQWFVMKNSPRQKGALKMVVAESSDVDIQKDLGGFPAYGPAQSAWAKGQSSQPIFASDPSSVLVQAGKDTAGLNLFVEPGLDLLGTFSNTVGPKLKSGGTLAASIPAWQQALVQSGTDYGLTVKTAK